MHVDGFEVADIPRVVAMTVGDYHIVRLRSEAPDNPVERIATRAGVDKQGSFGAFNQIHGGVVASFNHPAFIAEYRNR